MSLLSERAMLASLHISSWSGMMLDREITDEVNDAYKADKAAGRYNKRLVASKFLAEISTAENNARKAHRILTLPWEDDGTRVLASMGYLNYTSTMKEKQYKVRDAVKAFLEPDNVKAVIADGKIRLGKMFDEADYPGLETLTAKFGFDVEIKPMPVAGDFRAQLSDASTKAIVKDIERRSNERLNAAMNDVFNRVTEVVGHMTEKLREYTPAKDGNKAQGTIRDSVVYNIHQLAELLPTLNITDDPRIELLRKQMLEELVEHSPEIIRADAKVRQATINKADKLLKKVKSYMA